MDTWTWIQEHPAQAAWLLIAGLSALVLVWRSFEARIKHWAHATETTVDDRIVRVIACTVRYLAAVVDLLRLVVPTVFGKKPPEVEETERRIRKRLP